MYVLNKYFKCIFNLINVKRYMYKPVLAITTVVVRGEFSQAILCIMDPEISCDIPNEEADIIHRRQSWVG